MELSIKEKKENLLLKRVEVQFEVEFNGPTPNRKEVKEKLCTILKTTPELLVIDQMKQEFGSKKLTGYAKVYADAAATGAEQPHKMRRERGEKAVKKTKAKKAAPAKK